MGADVSRDRFTGSATCTAKARGARLDGDRLSFDRGRHVEMSEADYRLDGGPAQKLSSLTSDSDYRESFHFDPNGTVIWSSSRPPISPACNGSMCGRRRGPPWPVSTSPPCPS